MKSLPSRRFGRFGISRSAGRSASSATQVEATDTTVSASQSTVTASPSTILNDGVATATVTVTARNAAGTVLSGKTPTIAATGSSNTLVQPGTTDVNGEATGTIASTTAESKTVSATIDGVSITDTATVTTAATLSPVFFSDWETQSPGATDAIVQDTVGAAKWDFIGGSSELEVVNAASAGVDTGCPTTNCLKVPYSPASFSLIRKTGMSIPDVGHTRTYRWYFRCDMPTSDSRVTDWSIHPVQDGQAGSNCNWVAEYNMNHGTQFLSWYYIGGGGASSPAYPNYAWDGPLLDKGVWYRFEAVLHRTGTNTMLFYPYVFAADGTEVANPSDYVNASATLTLATAEGNIPTTGDFPFNNVANLDGLNAGTNDTYTLSPASPQLLTGYQAAFAVVDDAGGTGLIGPYGNVTGE